MVRRPAGRHILSTEAGWSSNLGMSVDWSDRPHLRINISPRRQPQTARARQVSKVVDRPSNKRRGTLDMIDLTVVLVVSSLRSLNALTVVMVTVVMGDGLRKSPAASTTISFLQSRNEHLTL